MLLQVVMIPECAGYQTTAKALVLMQGLRLHACAEPPLLPADSGVLGMARSRNALLDHDARKRALSVSQSLRVR